jgi:hypothetical protein
MKKIYIIIVAVLIVSLFVGYAAGRGYKTYEINLEKNSAPTQSISSLESFEKEQVDPDFYAPKILAVETVKDQKDGYNLKLKTSNFKFTADNFDKSLEQNTGFAYVSVNGQGVGRIYSPVSHIPESFFKSGTNTISITLQGNNYKTWWSKKGTLEARYNLEINK